MYCAIQDIINDVSELTLVQITNDEDIATNVNIPLVEAKIAEISAYIDSYLLARYSTPVEDLSDLQMLKPICVSLVICDLYQRRIGLDYSESLQSRRNKALSDLDKLQKGTMKLNSGTADGKPSYFKVSKKDKYFTDDFLLTI